MAVSRYVVVSTDNADKTIKDGPLLWDGATTWLMASSRQSMLESTALASSYVYPALPAADQNAAILRSRANAALIANGSYQAIGTPTNAQVAAQVLLLTKECNALIRLTLALFDDTSGT